MSASIPEKENPQEAALYDVGKTSLYYEYTSVNVKEDHVIEKTLTSLLKDPDVPNENIRIVTYYLVQKFFIKSVNEKKENIDLISQIPGAFKKMIESLPKNSTDKKILVKYFNLYLTHTISTQQEQESLFKQYHRVFDGFMRKLNAQNKSDQQNAVQNKEAVIDQIYQYIDTTNFASDVIKKLSKERARKKIDIWINRIFENHVIKGALDIIIALEEYCREEVDLSKQRVDFLKKYSKLNLEKISREILNNSGIRTIEDGWPVISENIFIYIDNLTKEHGDYKKFLEEIFSPLDKEFVEFFFSHFFTISTYQKQIEKDIYLVEKTFRDLHLLGKFKKFFTSAIHEKIMEGQEKAFYIENYFHKTIFEIKGAHKNAFAYFTLKYLLEDTLEEIKDKNGNIRACYPFYKKAFTDLIRAKYPKFLDKLVFIYLKQSKDLERKIGNTKKSFSNIYKKDTSLLKNIFDEFGLNEDYNRSILPCITGFEQSNQILKKQ